MNRDIYKNLLEWKDQSERKPLLLRGARQIGKSFIVNEFGKNEFQNAITINFERNPEYKDIFTTIVPHEIIERIALFTSQKIIIGKTLLFLDEIQDCPNAIVAMRYFFEEMPELHIIGAGSLLEFTLRSDQFKMPVGRIEYLYMFPLSFGEFLDALGENSLREYIKNTENLTKIPETLHNRINELVRKYFLIGGMPAVVNEYCKNTDILRCFKLQQSILDTYTDDFAKYASKHKHQLLIKLFKAVPAMVGQKFVYARVDQDMKSGELQAGLEMLEMAGIVTRIKNTSGAGLPLELNAKNNYFKTIFLDIGLMHCALGIHQEIAKEKELTAIFKGAVSEQFVGQELIANQPVYTKPSVYYWVREERNSQAEIDYLISKDSAILPIEVKSGPTGRLRSLDLFLKTFNYKTGYKISQAKYLDGNPVISIPLYGIEALMQ